MVPLLHSTIKLQDWRSEMDLARKFGIGIVMIIPAFVGSGALWHIFHSFIPVVVWFIIVAFVARGIVTGRLSSMFRGRT
jgi:hypothetical protein